ncbi:hypothetical protein [Psychromicrobium sp. YIM B11713]|uniref:hypothetical protein n=1 Tax=Psychromicrobium sp. YIM B11713 TaxID=3145233 RepID=UPI00374EB50C
MASRSWIRSAAAWLALAGSVLVLLLTAMSAELIFWNALLPLAVVAVLLLGWFVRTRGRRLRSQAPASIIVLGEPAEVKRVLQRLVIEPLAEQALLGAVLPPKYITDGPQRLGWAPVLGSAEELTEIVKVTGANTLIVAGSADPVTVGTLRRELARYQTALFVVAELASLEALLSSRSARHS